VAAFDAERQAQQIAHLAPRCAEVVTLDAMRLDPAWLTNSRNYLDPLNFVTNSRSSATGTVTTRA